MRAVLSSRSGRPYPAPVQRLRSPQKSLQRLARACGAGSTYQRAHRKASNGRRAARQARIPLPTEQPAERLTAPQREQHPERLRAYVRMRPRFHGKAHVQSRFPGWTPRNRNAKAINTISCDQDFESADLFRPNFISSRSQIPDMKFDISDSRNDISRGN